MSYDCSAPEARSEEKEGGGQRRSRPIPSKPLSTNDIGRLGAGPSGKQRSGRRMDGSRKPSELKVLPFPRVLRLCSQMQVSAARRDEAPATEQEIGVFPWLLCPA